MLFRHFKRSLLCLFKSSDAHQQKNDKRVVTDFRYLNMHMAKNNLAYPLLKDIFALLCSSKYEVMSVLDLKDAFQD